MAAGFKGLGTGEGRLRRRRPFWSYRADGLGIRGGECVAAMLGAGGGVILLLRDLHLRLGDGERTGGPGARIFLALGLSQSALPSNSPRGEGEGSGHMACLSLARAN